MPATLQSSLRALFGRWAGDRPTPLPLLPPDLPDAVRDVAGRAVPMLAQYQGIDHARLYLHRLRRFIGRPGVSDMMAVRIAQLMAERMSYRDPVRMAQLILTDAGAPRRPVYRLDDLIMPLPDVIADPLLAAARWLRRGHRRVALRYRPDTAPGRARLRFEAGLRHWRALGRTARRERIWVERWLHMIDRALTLQPAAAMAIVETATLIQGHGETYRQGLADWHRIIDGHVKPVFDGRIADPDLTKTITALREAACKSPRLMS